MTVATVIAGQVKHIRTTVEQPQYAVRRRTWPQALTNAKPAQVPKEGKPDRVLAPVRIHTFPLSRLCPAKGELASAQILGLGLQHAGWPMQGNGAQYI